METPEFFHCNAPFPSEKRLSDAKATDHFIIDDLLDFPNDDVTDAPASADSSSATPLDTSCNSSSFSTPAADPYFQPADAAGNRSFVDGHFSNELCVPYDELAELEWLSNMVDESFSSEDMQKLHLIQGMKARTNEGPQAQHYNFEPEPTHSGPTHLSGVSVPAKARSKRSRAAPGSWTSRLLMVAPSPASSDAPALSSSSESDIATAAGKKSPKAGAQRRKEAAAASESSGGGEGRRCLHCATDKTPQWRTGPMGPKTLCNACGVRYKSGRLVPEYRPAASPTFVLTKHSNSHRKVLELRRQKEMVRAQQHQHQFMHHHHHHQSMMFDVSNADDYLIHQHIGPDFRQLI